MLDLAEAKRILQDRLDAETLRQTFGLAEQ